VDNRTASPETARSVNRSILVVGGGIAGITAAVEAAEVGYDVVIVEKEAYLGGRVAQLNKYFPKLCPPACGLEINFQRIKNNPRIRFFTLAERLASLEAGRPPGASGILAAMALRTFATALRIAFVSSLMMWNSQIWWGTPGKTFASGSG